MTQDNPDAAGAVRRTPRPATSEIETREALRLAIKRHYDDNGLDAEDIPAGHYNRIVAVATKLIDERTVEREALQARVAELQGKLTRPCGECHPCTNWADETWRRAGRTPPSVVRWEDKLAEAKSLDARLDDAIKLIEEMSNHLRQEPALTIGVETRLAALRADEPTGEVSGG